MPCATHWASIFLPGRVGMEVSGHYITLGSVMICLSCPGPPGCSVPIFPQGHILPRHSCQHFFKKSFSPHSLDKTSSLGTTFGAARMEVVLCFAGIIHLAKKLKRKYHEVKIKASVFEYEITISCSNLVRSANSLNTANKNLETLYSEHTESPIFKHMNKQLPLFKEGQQGIRNMLKWLALQAQSFEGSLGFIVMWKWKNMKPIFDWLEAQMQFMLLNILVINSTVELNIMEKFLTTPGNGSPPLCRSRLYVLDHRQPVVQRLLTRPSKHSAGVLKTLRDRSRSCRRPKN